MKRMITFAFIFSLVCIASVWAELPNKVDDDLSGGLSDPQNQVGEKYQEPAKPKKIVKPKVIKKQVKARPKRKKKQVSGPMVTRIFGRVVKLDLQGRTRSLAGRTPLSAGDKIYANKDAHFSIWHGVGVKMDFTAGSRVEIVQRGSQRAVKLLYGSAQLTVNKLPQGMSTFALLLPNGIVEAPKGLFLAHVAESQSKNQKRLAGKFVAIPDDFSGLKQWHSQVACLEHQLQVHPPSGDPQTLYPGDGISITNKTPDFAPSRIGKGEIQASRRVLGFVP